MKEEGREGLPGSESLGDYIRSRRLQTKKSVAELADEIGVTPSFINKVENGMRPITSLNTAVLLSDALHIPVDQIFALQNLPSPDIVELVRKCSAFHMKRMRWALTEIANGRMFTEEIEQDFSDVLDNLPGPILIQRKRTKKEKRDWRRYKITKLSPTDSDTTSEGQTS